MQKKTIEKAIIAKMEEWLSSISDNSLKKDVKNNLLVTGGCITSMFLQEEINDFDVYIQDVDVMYRLAKYYSTPFSIEVLDYRNKEDLLKNLGEQKGINFIQVENLKPGQIKLNLSGNSFVKTDKEGSYEPTFFSPNAISLNNKLQIVCRFTGTSEEIHNTFDFIHATNYFTFKEGLVTNLRAVESILTKQLFYQGSLYPLTSIIRIKKFVNRKWRINAGEMLKMMFQVSKLNLEDVNVLEDQLIGVDVAYFGVLINAIRNTNKETLTQEYLFALIDKIFNSEDISN